jgi:signal transduction histidine kinase/PAS domain-containing protein
MKLHLNITGKFTLILVLFGTALLSGLGALAFASGRAGLQEAATSELSTRANEKQAALDSWIGVARINIAAQAESPIVVEQAAALLSAAPGSPQAEAAHNQLVRELQPHVGSESEFLELFFVEAETGQVFVSTDPSEEGKFKENLSFFIQGKSEPYVSEMYYSTSLGHPAMTAAAPVVTADGHILGVLAGRLDLEVLNTLISRRTGLRQTDDASLTNATGLLVTQPRFISDPGILQITLKGEAVKLCLEGNSGVISADDYRDVPALISYRWLPEQRMCLIVKIDQAEAFAPSLAFGRTVAWASGTALVLGVVIASVLARTFTHPILALQTGAKRLSQGDLEYRVAVKSNDEIGGLAAAFNEMAASLEKQVAERKQAERMREALYTIAQTAITAESLQDLYTSIQRALGNLIPVENFYIALYSSDTDLISFPYSVDQYDESSPPQKPGHGLTEYVLRTGRPLLADQQTFTQLVQQGDVDLVGTASLDWLGVPLKVGAQVIGVMAVQSYTETVRFGTPEKEMLEFVSTQVANAIERKQAEQALRHSHNLLNLTGQMAKVGGWELDLETQTLGWTEEVYRIHEVDPATRPNIAEAINFYAPEARPVISAAVQAGIDSGTPWDLELPLITAQDRRIWARAQGAAERRDGRIIRLYGAFQDITERKQAEEKIQIHAAHTASLLHVAELLNAQLDLDSVLTTVCQEAAKVLNAPAGFINLFDPSRGLLVFSGMFGLPEEFGKRYIVPPYELFERYVAQMGQLFVVQDVQALTDQEAPNLELYRSVNARTIANSTMQRSNKLIGVLSVMTFVMERQFRDDELALLKGLADQAALAIANARLFSDLQTYTARLEQSNRDLQEFAYVASHDLQEPLRKVLAFSDRIANKYGGALDETGRDYLKRMQGASQRMQTLINDLLNFSRVSTLAQSFTEVDLNTLAQEVLSDLENHINRTKGHVEISELPTIEADPTQMHQLLQNLIGNALKFHSKETQPLVKVSAQIKDRECQISVQDNGIGFDIRYLGRIFKPFQRLHNREEYEGSGVGLAICRRIVERHGGRITATSAPGEGSTFIVTLPIHQSRGDK